MRLEARPGPSSPPVNQELFALIGSTKHLPTGTDSVLPYPRVPALLRIGQGPYGNPGSQKVSIKLVCGQHSVRLGQTWPAKARGARRQLQGIPVSHWGPRIPGKNIRTGQVLGPNRMRVPC